MYIFGNDAHVSNGRLVVDISKQHAYIKGVNTIIGRTPLGRNAVAVGNQYYLYEPFEEVTADQFDGVVAG